MNKQEKACRSFNYACNQASKCRHEKYMVSCYDCPEEKTCEIQQRLDKAKSILYPSKKEVRNVEL